MGIHLRRSQPRSADFHYSQLPTPAYLFVPQPGSYKRTGYTRAKRVKQTLVPLLIVLVAVGFLLFRQYGAERGPGGPPLEDSVSVMFLLGLPIVNQAQYSPKGSSRSALDLCDLLTAIGNSCPFSFRSRHVRLPIRPPLHLIYASGFYPFPVQCTLWSQPVPTKTWRYIFS